ncbi:unnamed protein product [Orchesella dallaii]|uniref:Uncharacterized protein n=1 Tax=Orchesella dallaii TaxID=48710 RepID=A0ABP1S6T5_9HEXA
MPKCKNQSTSTIFDFPLPDSRPTYPTSQIPRGVIYCSGSVHKLQCRILTDTGVCASFISYFLIPGAYLPTLTTTVKAANGTNMTFILPPPPPTSPSTPLTPLTDEQLNTLNINSDLLPDEKLKRQSVLREFGSAFAWKIEDFGVSASLRAAS